MVLFDVVVNAKVTAAGKLSLFCASAQYGFYACIFHHQPSPLYRSNRNLDMSAFFDIIVSSYMYLQVLLRQGITARPHRPRGEFH
jgi:hypothetical protein